MAIQVRRGPAAKFDPQKLLPGEWAVELNSKKVHMCFAAGDTRRMATYEEMKENIESCTEEIREQLIADVEEAGASAAKAELDTMRTQMDNKADVGHTHDGRYYTEDEVDAKLSEKQEQIDMLAQSSGALLFEDVSVTNTADKVWYIGNDNYIHLVESDASGGNMVASLLPVSPGEICKISLTHNPYYYVGAYPLITAAASSPTAGVYEIINDKLATQGDEGGTYSITVPEGAGYLLINSASAPTVQKAVSKAAKLATPRKINGISFDGTEDVTFFGMEPDPEGVVEKTASIPNFTLTDGVKITICFGFGCLVDNATLNVSGTGAYPIMLNATTPLPNNIIDYGDIAELVYHGGKWYLTGCTAWGRMLCNIHAQASIV